MLAGFTDVGSAPMKMLADARGMSIEEADKKELVEKFSTMPPHPEAPAALRGRFRLFTFTHNLLEVQTRQLENAGIVASSSVALRRRRQTSQAPSLEAYAQLRGVFE